MVKKDDRCFTFVVSRSSKNRIRIRRLEIPKRWLQTCAATLVASLGIISFNLLGLNHYSSDQLFAKQISGNLETKNFLARVHGEGGPDELNGNEALSDSTALQEKIRALEELFDKRASIPSIYPLNGKINNEFGMRRDPFGGSTYENHAGMDIDGDKGAPVIAPGDGVIIFAGWKGGYGNLVEISHGNNLTTRYGHLSEIETQVGESVSRGQQIGRVGSTGRSTGPHLHYEVRINDEAINPRAYLPSESSVQ